MVSDAIYRRLTWIILFVAIIMLMQICVHFAKGIITGSLLQKAAVHLDGHLANTV